MMYPHHKFSLKKFSILLQIYDRVQIYRVQMLFNNTTVMYKMIGKLPTLKHTQKKKKKRKAQSIQ